MTQNDRLSTRLLKGYRVTPNYAKRVLNISNVRARVNELRNEGYQIRTITTRRGTTYYTV